MVDIPVHHAPAPQHIQTCLYMNHPIDAAAPPALRNHLFLVSLISLCLFGFLKLLYPEPDFFSDSYSYIFAAQAGIDANIWPIGYSKFLRLVHYFSHSDVVLVWLQYLLYIASAVYFYFTILSLYQPKHDKKWIIAAVLFFNPLVLFIANYVTSDLLFCSLSLVWIGSLLWIINRHTIGALILHGTVLFLAFTVRYNAMIYPIVGSLAILCAVYNWRVKLAAILVPWTLVGTFIWHSRAEAERITGIAQFPILSGWQWGNNALYMYEHIDVDNASMPTPETRELDAMAKQFFKVTPPEERDLPNYVANYFIRQGNAPLKKYLDTHYLVHSDLGQVIAWGRVSPIYAEFGKKLIKEHPGAFFRYYLLLNTRNYFIPPLEKLEKYNLGYRDCWKTAQYWFDWPSPTLHPKVPPHFMGQVLALFPSMFLVLNVYYLFLLFSMAMHIPIARPQFGAATLVLVCFFALNFCFSVFANIIVIRYQVFPMLLFVCFSALAVEEVLMQKLERRQDRRLIPTN